MPDSTRLSRATTLQSGANAFPRAETLLVSQLALWEEQFYLLCWCISHGSTVQLAFTAIYLDKLHDSSLKDMEHPRPTSPHSASEKYLTWQRLSQGARNSGFQTDLDNLLTPQPHFPICETVLLIPLNLRCGGVLQCLWIHLSSFQE